jgi:hypothetical protein
VFLSDPGNVDTESHFTPTCSCRPRSSVNLIHRRSCAFCCGGRPEGEQGAGVNEPVQERRVRPLWRAAETEMIRSSARPCSFA